MPAPFTKKVLLAEGLVEILVTAKGVVAHTATMELQDATPGPVEKANSPQGSAAVAPIGQYVFASEQIAPEVLVPAAHVVPAGQRACAVKGVVGAAHKKPGAQRGAAVALPLPGAKQ